MNMFCNGTEYIAFLEEECGNCPHYVPYEQATSENPCCEVEEAIALAGAGMPFPYEWLDENDYIHRYDCRKKAGKGKKVAT